MEHLWRVGKTQGLCHFFVNRRSGSLSYGVSVITLHWLWEMLWKNILPQSMSLWCICFICTRIHHERWIRIVWRWHQTSQSNRDLNRPPNASDAQIGWWIWSIMPTPSVCHSRNEECKRSHNAEGKIWKVDWCSSSSSIVFVHRCSFCCKKV